MQIWGIFINWADNVNCKVFERSEDGCTAIKVYKTEYVFFNLILEIAFTISNANRSNLASKCIMEIHMILWKLNFCIFLQADTVRIYALYFLSSYVSGRTILLIFCRFWCFCKLQYIFDGKLRCCTFPFWANND